MRKALAIILVLLTSFSLFACGNGNGNGNQNQAESPGASAPASSPAGNAAEPADKVIDLDEIGFYDPDYDYFSGPKYKIQYMSLDTGILYETNYGIYGNWCRMMNMEYGEMWTANGDNDLFLNTLVTFANNGVDGFLFDPDTTVYARIKELCDENNVKFMTCMGPARDMSKANAPLIYPAVGFDFYELGAMQLDQLLKFKNESWSDVDLKDIGVIAITMSTMPPIHDRVLGGQAVWAAAGGNPDNFFIADCAVGQFNTDTAGQQTQAILQAQGTKYTHWLIQGNVDDLAMGAVAVIDNFGLDDVTCIVCVGGPGLYVQWDSGIQNCWKYALACGNQVFGEPSVGALYAFLRGWATPETIWPKWVDVNDHGEGSSNYAKFILPTQWVDHENYRNYLEWSDLYGGVDDYPYDVPGIKLDSFTSRGIVPDSYKTSN